MVECIDSYMCRQIECPYINRANKCDNICDGECPLINDVMDIDMELF